MRILYNSDEIRQAITDLFIDKSVRRVAIVAFVGGDAHSFLPYPEGIELVCWAKAGGTNADGLRRLIKRGVNVRITNNLHMKLYWAEGKGAVITSANLSRNALGAGNLQEIGVLVTANTIDIERVLSSLKSRAVTQNDLLRLDDEGREIDIAIRNISKTQTKVPQVNFKEWFELPNHRKWKLGWWDSTCSTALVAKKISILRYGVADPKEMLACNGTDYHGHDWILSFGLVDGQATDIEWRTIDFVVKVPSSDKKAYSKSYPYQAIQVFHLEHYPPPPFTLDKIFRQAFKKAISEYGAAQIKQLKTTRVPPKIIERLIELHDVA